MEIRMSTLTLTLATLATAAAGLLAAAGVYAESHRAPDQS
jgi:hypothetical protein